MQEYKIMCEKCGHWNKRSAIIYLFEEDAGVSKKVTALFNELALAVSKTTRPPTPPDESAGEEE